MVMYDLCVSDHIPVCLNIDFDHIPMVTVSHDATLRKLDWTRLSKNDIVNYTNLTDFELSKVNTPSSALRCTNVNCEDESHRNSINCLYNDIVSAIMSANGSAFKLGRNHNNASFNRPGWNDHVAKLHHSAREAFKLWRCNGKPRYGYMFDLMKTTRMRFKYALRELKHNENSLRRDALASKMIANPRSFWKNVKEINSYKVPLPNSVDGICGDKPVCEMWMNHYKQLFNCFGNTNNNVINKSNDIYTDIIVSCEEVASAIMTLDNGKAVGLDQLSVEHLKNSSERLLSLLSDMLSMCFIHGYLPDELMSVVLLPLVKDKNKRLSDKNNYRPIAIANVITKVLEVVILNRISDCIITTCNQFGFKAKLSTDLCIYALKEVIDKYKSLNGTIFMCFLDASKAFDKVNHGILFKKLLDHGVPIYIVRLLAFWYSNQLLCVRWAGMTSASFRMTNGVRQGGILSPYLFNLYMNDLSVKLSKCNTGCYIGDTSINHIMYADDLVVFSPCVVGLMDLLQTCEIYANDHDIVYNSQKSAILEFCNSTGVNNLCHGCSIHGNQIPVVDSVKYLGHIICNNFKDDSDMLRQCRYLYAQGNTLKRNFHMCTESVKRSLFRAYCYSLYTCQLWWNYTATMFRRMKVAYNDCYRMLMGLPRSCSASNMFVRDNILSFDELLRHLIHRFTLRIDKCENVIIGALVNSDVFYCSHIRNHWLRALLVTYPRELRLSRIYYTRL